jgi:hypothetical protein
MARGAANFNGRQVRCVSRIPDKQAVRDLRWTGFSLSGPIFLGFQKEDRLNRLRKKSVQAEIGDILGSTKSSPVADLAS